MNVSIIVPTLNEADYITETIRHIERISSDVEIVVVDGGSCDTTCHQVSRTRAKLIHCERGRGIQFNMGARHTSGELLLFLHADCRLPPTAFEDLQGYYSHPEHLLATFRLRFDASSPLLGIYSWFTRFDSMLTSFGDQCISIRRSFFEELGGFPNWRLFEDVHLLRMARRKTRIHSLKSQVSTSARRFKKIGVLRTQMLNAWLLYQYRRGVEPELLAQNYYHLFGKVPEEGNSTNPPVSGLLTSKESL